VGVVFYAGKWIESEFFRDSSGIHVSWENVYLKQLKPLGSFIRRLDTLDASTSFSASFPYALPPDSLNRYIAHWIEENLYSLSPGDSSVRAYWHAAMYRYLKLRKPDYTYVPPLSGLDTLPVEKQTDTLNLLFLLPPFDSMTIGEIYSVSGMQKNYKGFILWAFLKKLADLSAGRVSIWELKGNFLSKITWAMFFILPIIGIFVFFMYRKSGYNYAETLAFMFYLQSAYVVLLIIQLLLDLLPYVRGWTDVVINLFFLYFLVRSFQVFYGERKAVTIRKLMFGVIPAYLFFTVALMIALISFLFVTV